MNQISAAIITIGDELLIGQTIDTNSAFIGSQLNQSGIWLKRRIAVGDVREEILKALEEQSKDNNIIIITGGLGPTADDITKPVLCEYFNTKLVVDDEALNNVKQIFEKLKKPLLETNTRQAEVPENCVVLQNRRGTAPGMWFEKNNVIYVSLPGVPHEMKGLLSDGVIPKLKERFDLPLIQHRTLLLAGKGESEIAEIIKDFESSLPRDIKLAYLPAYGMVRLRLTSVSAADRKTIIDEYFTELQARVREWMVINEDVSLAEALSRMLRERKQTMSTAESCTGGFIAHMITAIAGSSDVFRGSVIAYDNSVKKELLGVKQETLEKHGAVSEQTVTEMARGLLASIGADYALATSGIMGPSGGSAEKPVGTVWIAVGNKQKIQAARFQFRFDRSRNIELTANTALNMLRKFILQCDAEKPLASA